MPKQINIYNRHANTHISVKEVTPFTQEKGNSTWTVEVFPYENFPHVSLKVCNFDAIFSSVGPVNVSLDNVDGNSVDRVEGVDDDVFDARSIEIGTTDLIEDYVRPVDFV